MKAPDAQRCLRDAYRGRCSNWKTGGGSDFCHLHGGPNPKLRRAVTKELVSAALALEPHVMASGHLAWGSGGARESFKALHAALKAYRAVTGGGK